ncbi:MAG: hypothetical protein ACHQJD_00205 [Thermoanaerobaculia bacterium]
MNGTLCVVLLIVAAAGRADPPITVYVGDPVVDGSILEPYQNEWTFSYQNPGEDAVKAGRWTDALQRKIVRGRSVMVRTQVAVYDKKGLKVVTVNTFEPKTMAPISMDWSMGSGSLGLNQREFSGTHVKFRRRPRIRKMGDEPGNLTEGEATLEVPPFDFFGGMYGLLLAALPLREGLSIRFPAIEEDKEALSWVEVRVRGRSRVAAGKARTVEAWVVTAETHDGPMTFWLTRRPPYIIKLEFHPVGGPAWFYSMV